MRNATYLVLFFLLSAAAPVVAQIRGKGNVNGNRKLTVQYGTASYYSNKFQGRETANGERYDKTKMTCAHNSLPFETWVKVTNLRNKRSVIVRVTDRLHHKNKRVVDLSRAAAAKLGYVKRGLARVKVEVLPKSDWPVNEVP